tara:strand:- start:2171 stop:2386 length:216 start_codon:yes stop_codon:yes gene_type:complete
MNETNRKFLWKLIQTCGDQLKGKLKSHPSHPKGRNSYAHVCSVIKSNFGCSYKEIHDEDFDKLVIFIKNIK